MCQIRTGSIWVHVLANIPVIFILFHMLVCGFFARCSLNTTAIIVIIIICLSELEYECVFGVVRVEYIAFAQTCGGEGGQAKQSPLKIYIAAAAAAAVAVAAVFGISVDERVRICLQTFTLLNKIYHRWNSNFD